MQASIATNERCDTTMMRRLFDEIADPARVAALMPALDHLERQRFGLRMEGDGS